MRKQTKLVAVLSTAALLAIGASMTSFAATGWAEEDGTWVYYNKDGERATEQWKKSGNNWYYLDSNGEMAIDQLIDDDNNYYYVDINGVMASNQWVAIENEDAGNDDEPDQNWYYFQANGKALTNGDNSKVSLKTINGKKYAFDEDGKMLWGWVNENNAEHIDDTDGNAFETGTYYFGGSDDGAMTTGWIQLDITYDGATNNDYKYISAAFNDDEDQTRWFYFKSNGKKIAADVGDYTKDKTINGRKYAFDENGAMVAEWSLDAGDFKTNTGYTFASRSSVSYTQMDRASNSSGYHASNVRAYDNLRATLSDGSGVGLSSSSNGGNSVLTGNGKYAKYSQTWKYFNSVEDGSRVSRGWFKVVAAEYLNADKYNDDEDAWYYADGSGNIYAGEFKTIKGKKYAFRNDGRMVNGLQFIYQEKGKDNLIVAGDDDDYFPFDTEDDFLQNAGGYYAQQGYKCYYFGGADDGAMRTGKATVEIDGDNYSFNFEKSGTYKGAGTTGEKDDKLYMAGMMLKAGSDEKYQVVKQTIVYDKDYSNGGKALYTSLVKLDDAEAFIDNIGASNAVKLSIPTTGNLTIGSTTRSAKDLKEAWSIKLPTDNGAAVKTEKYEYYLINSSGKVVDKSSKSKDGNDFYYVTDSKGKIDGIYVED